MYCFSFQLAWAIIKVKKKQIEPEGLEMEEDKNRKWFNNNDSSREESYMWTDNEIEIILNITQEYKVKRMQKNHHLIPLVLKVVGE